MRILFTIYYRLFTIHQLTRQQQIFKFMALTTEQYERMIRFMDAEMETEEMAAFEKELASNPEMSRQLDFEQSLRDDFALQNITSLPGALPANEKAPARKIPGKVTRMQKWWAISAAAVAIIVLALFTMLWQKPGNSPVVANRKSINTIQKKSTQPETVITTPEKDSSKVTDLASLFTQYFKKDAIPDDYPLFLAQAFMDYESGNYKTLQQLNLNNLPQTRSAGETDDKENILKLGHYYKGLAFLQTDNTREAIINLEWVLAHQPGKFLGAKAQWYLALTYLKEKDEEKTVELCRSIINNKENDTLIKKVESILNTLRK